MVKDFCFNIEKQNESQLFNIDKLEIAEKEIKNILSNLYIIDSLSVIISFVKNEQEIMERMTTLNVMSSDSKINNNTLQIYKKTISMIVYQVLDKYNIKDKYYESSNYKQLQSWAYQIKKQLSDK